MEEKLIDRLRRLREDAIRNETVILPVLKKLYSGAKEFIEYVSNELEVEAGDPYNIVPKRIYDFGTEERGIKAFFVSALCEMGMTLEEAHDIWKKIPNKYDIDSIELPLSQYKEIFGEDEDDEKRKCISARVAKKSANKKSEEYVRLFVSKRTLESLCNEKGLLINFVGGCNISAPVPIYTYEEHQRLTQKPKA